MIPQSSNIIVASKRYRLRGCVYFIGSCYTCTLALTHQQDHAVVTCVSDTTDTQSTHSYHTPATSKHSNGTLLYSQWRYDYKYFLSKSMSTTELYLWWAHTGHTMAIVWVAGSYLKQQKRPQTEHLLADVCWLKLL